MRASRLLAQGAGCGTDACPSSSGVGTVQTPRHAGHVREGLTSQTGQAPAPGAGVRPDHVSGSRGHAQKTAGRLRRRGVKPASGQEPSSVMDGSGLAGAGRDWQPVPAHAAITEEPCPALLPSRQKLNGA